MPSSDEADDTIAAKNRTQRPNVCVKATASKRAIRVRGKARARTSAATPGPERSATGITQAGATDTAGGSACEEDIDAILAELNITPSGGPALQVSRCTDVLQTA